MHERTLVAVDQSVVAAHRRSLAVCGVGNSSLDGFELYFYLSISVGTSSELHLTPGGLVSRTAYLLNLPAMSPKMRLGWRYFGTKTIATGMQNIQR